MYLDLMMNNGCISLLFSNRIHFVLKKNTEASCIRIVILVSSNRNRQRSANG